ncbi:hypothetical protein [Mucilaginibacter jinjuensis]|uniref:DUF8188 domain-containing protein n=1 Tax=Mucilaginibacter jinjuensis TaxID=1176721 RepID=A0ABY7T9G3_9SPHI|nr:hypothetical protein [Mucilaginibacter jinjuensis]WCT13125.1 hypothetical protein PQO05_04150 [Mucilaginibacter jinjuensis]
MAIIGMALGKMLWPMLGEYMQKKSINVVEMSDVKKYSDNSKPIELMFNKYNYKQTYYKGNLFYSGDGGTFAPYKICSNYVFYDTVYRNFFAIQMFNFIGVSSFDELLEIANHVKISCIVNNWELGNPNYGTADNPIPIFKCIVPDNNSWNDYAQSRADIIKRNNEHYQKSIFYHLTYFTPKEEFQKMFPEQK